jgi:hypothetical protein
MCRQRYVAYIPISMIDHHDQSPHVYVVRQRDVGHGRRLLVRCHVVGVLPEVDVLTDMKIL